MRGIFFQQLLVGGKRILVASQPGQAIGAIVIRVIAIELLPGVKRGRVIPGAVFRRGLPLRVVEQVRRRGEFFLCEQLIRALIIVLPQRLPV